MTGTRLGAYEILALIGAGGMGEVYRARDTRLNRDVALKVLPELFAADPERLARFKREAQLLASLNHPNIAAIHGFEEAGGVQALVLELVEGPTLADRIAHGPIPLDEALPIARQIAEALEAAHEQGVIHRDLKPANIKVRPDGTVKVLDFGLAKAFEPAVASGGFRSDTMSPTITSPVGTRMGIILGTAAYMSPEQARGKPIDKRADIWAFGCVLYEMLTGRRPFEGDDVADVLARILEREPDMRALPAATPERIRDLLRRCFEKNPARRLRDIGDAGLDIHDALSRDATRAEAHRGVTSWTIRRVALASAALCVLASGVAVYLARGMPPVAAVRPAQVQVLLPPGVHVAVDTDHPALALSPDGSQIAFIGDENGRRQLYVRNLADQEARVIPGTEGAASPFYSPDGSWVGFFDGGLLKKVAPGGGVPIAVSASTPASVNRGATWTLNNTIIMASSPNSGLSRTSAAENRQRGLDEWTSITDDYKPYAWPHALPDGEHILFTDHAAGRQEDAVIAVVSRDGSALRTIVNGGTNPRFSSTGHLLFARSGSLYAVALDPETAEAEGQEQLLLSGLMTGQNGAAQFAVAANGTLAYIPGMATPTQHELVWVDRTGRTEPLLDGGRTYEDARLSPDGARLAFTSPEGANFDVWVRDLVRGSTTRVTSDSGEDFEPVWSPDGARMAIASEVGQSDEGPGLAWITAFGQPPEQLLKTPGFGHWEFPSSWSPDGDWLAFAMTTGGTSRNLMLLRTSGPRTPIAFVATPADESAATFSPDGEWIAYVSDETGREEVYVRPFPGPGAAMTISSEGGVEPRWARDGRQLFYRNGTSLMAVNIEQRPHFLAAPPALLFEGRFEMKGYGGSSANYDVAKDGRFVMVRRKNQVMPTAIHLVFNWPRTLAAR